MNTNPEIDKFIQEHTGKHFCKCGCNGVIIIRRHHRNNGIPKYIHNHGIKGENNWNYKGVDKWIIEHTGKHFCGCPCNGVIIIKRDHYHTRIPKYICGHHPISEETGKKISKAKKGKEHSGTFKKGQLPLPESSYGKRSYVYSPLQNKEVVLRSSYETVLYLILEKLNEPWLYEHKTFKTGEIIYKSNIGETIHRIESTYTPDFYLPEFDEYYDTKGNITDESRVKIDKFRELCPDIKLWVLYKKDLEEMLKESGIGYNISQIRQLIKANPRHFLKEKL